MRILYDQIEIADAQAEFIAAIRSHCPEIRDVKIGFPGGHTRAKVMWLPNLGFWAFFGEPPHGKSPGKRYWNVFGIEEPRNMVPIACEINPPKQGINRHVAGAFARDGNGTTFVVHRGVLSAGGRIPTSHLRDFHWTWSAVRDGDTNSRVMAIGSLSDPNFALRLRDFILEIVRFKDAERSMPREV